MHSKCFLEIGLSITTKMESFRSRRERTQPNRVNANFKDEIERMCHFSWRIKRIF